MLHLVLHRLVWLRDPLLHRPGQRLDEGKNSAIGMVPLESLSNCCFAHPPLILQAFDVLSPTPEYRIPPEQLIKHILDDVSTTPGYDINAFLKGWFRGTDLADVKRGSQQVAQVDVCLQLCVKPL